MLKKLSLLVMVLTLSASPAFAQGKIAVSLFGGWAKPVKSSPIDGRDGYTPPFSSSVDSSWTLGGEACYPFANGLELGIGAQYMSFLTQASRSGGPEEDWTTIKATPVYLVGRYRLHFDQKFNWYGEGGVGYAFTSSDKEIGLYNMQTGLGETVNLSTSNDVAGFVGTGVGYRLSKDWMLSLGARYWWLSVDSDLTTASLGTVSKSTNNLDNVQVLLGITWSFSIK